MPLIAVYKSLLTESANIMWTRLQNTPENIANTKFYRSLMRLTFSKYECWATHLRRSNETELNLIIWFILFWFVFWVLYLNNTFLLENRWQQQQQQQQTWKIKTNISLTTGRSFLDNQGRLLLFKLGGCNAQFALSIDQEDFIGRVPRHSTEGQRTRVS